MCDCFHLAFPNWHGSPGTGAGRRLRGPEPDAEDDSVSEEPTQFIEGERPRPQGSSPVDEYPETEKYIDTDKQGEAELYDPLHKGGSGKKGKRAVFGSLFEKRSTAKMSQLEEIHSPESGVIVKTAKEACAEGLVVSGGGKDGIFIKEVRPESPASKNLCMKEGDQILSATVYFDNVTYEDALQILEHAQPYKMEFCLKRKPPETSTLESESALESETNQGEESSSPEMRGKGKTKRHGDARISWPKFPSFGKGRKSRFKRSHSSSEADEQRKLELSPTTSDTESPIKSQEAVKAKTKRHGIKLSGLKMKGRTSKSVEQPDEDTKAPTTGPLEGMEKQQTEDATNVHSPEGLESTSGETPQVYVLDEPEKIESTKTKSEYTIQNLTGYETTQQHKVELINLETTLKTTDITIALANQESASSKRSPEGKKKKKKERSELKFRIKGKEKADGSPKSKSKQKQDVTIKSSPQRLKTPGASLRTSEPFAYENAEMSPTVVSHTDQKGHQLPIDTLISTNSVTADMEMSMPKVDLSLDMSDVGLLRKSPQIGKEKVCGLLPSTAEVGKPYIPIAEIKDAQEISRNGKVTGIIMEPTMDIMDSQMEIQASKLSTEANIDDVLVELSTKTTPKFKLPTMDPADIVTDVTIKMTDVNVVKSKTDELLKTQLPKREDIEIPGMEDVSSTGTKTQVFKQPKAAFTDPIEGEIQAQTVQLAIDVDRVKEAVAKLPGFKLPKLDTSGLPAHREITMTDVNAKRIHVTAGTTLSTISDTKAKQDTYTWKSDISASPEKLSRTTVTTIKLPKNQFPDLGTHEPITVTHIDPTNHKDEAANINKLKENDVEIKIELLKREDLEIPGMEATKQTGHSQIPHIELENVEVCETGERECSQDTSSPSTVISFKGKYLPQVTIPLLSSKDTEQKAVIDNQKPCDNIDDNLMGSIDKGILDPETSTKGLDRRSKKGKIGFGITKPNIRFPDIGIDLPKMDTSMQKEDIKVTDMNMPEAEINLSKVTESEFTIPQVKTQETRLQTPTIDSFNSESMPETDIMMSKPNVDLSLTIKGMKSTDLKNEDPLLQKNMESEALITKEENIKDKNMKESPSKSKLPTFKLPRFGKFGKGQASVVISDTPEIKTSKVNTVENESSNVDITGQSIHTHKTEGKIKIPNIDKPSIGLSLPNVQEGALAKTEPDIKVPKVDVGGPQKDKVTPYDIHGKAGEVDIKVDSGEDGGQKRLKGIKLRMTLPDGKGPLQDTNIVLPEGKVNTERVEIEGQGSTFKRPTFGVSLPKIKVPEIDLSAPKTDLDVTSPEAKADVQIPDVELKESSIDVEIPEGAATDIDVKMKKPRMSFPKFGFSKPEVKGLEVDVSLPKVDISLPKGKVEVKEPELDIKAPESQVEMKDIEHERRGSKFKLPTFGVSLPKIKGPEIDLSVSKTDVDVTLPEAKAEVQIPDVDVIAPSGEVAIPEGSTDIDVKIKKPRISFPHIGFSKPEVKAPEVDVNLPKVDISLPEVKIVKEPEVEMKGPESQVEVKDVVGSPTKFKMPTFKFPKFGATAPNVTVEVPEITGPKLTISGEAPAVDIKEASVDIEGPSIDVDMKSKGVELEGHGSKFKLPTFGVSLPKVKRPEINVSMSKTDVDITLPEAKGDVQLPDVELKEPSIKVEIPEGAATDIDVKMKTPHISLPHIGFTKPEVKAPKVDVSLPKVDISLSKGNIEVKEPELDIKAPESQVEMKDIEHERRGSKFKLPTFGVSLPKIKGPEIDLSVSKTDVDVTLPEAKAEVQIPDVDVIAPSGEVAIPEGSTDIDVKIKKPRISFPHIGFSKPEVIAPEVDVNLPKVDISLPEVKIVKEPEVEMKRPESQVEVKDVVSSPTKFKMPTFKFPKFGATAPNVTVEVPDVNKDIKVHGAEITGAKLTISGEPPAVDIKEASVDIEGPSIDVDMKSKGVELEGHGSKFKLPTFGMSMPKIKGPEIDLSVSKTGVDVTSPEAKGEVQLPDVELKEPSIEVGIPEGAATDIDMKMKKPQMSFPKFGFSKPEVKAPEVDVSLSKVAISLPEEKVELKQPQVETITPESQVEVKDVFGSPTRFKMPSFKFPKFGATTPNVTVEVSDVNKDIKVHGAEITGPKLTISGEPPAVDIKQASVGIEGPSIDVDMKSKGVELEAHGSRFKLPKFGISMPKIKGPEIDLSVSKTGVDVTLPEAKGDVQLPDIEFKEPSIEVEIPEGAATDIELKMKKPRISFPNFGFSKPEVKAPEVDVSFPKVDISLPEGKVEVKEPEVEIKAPETQVEVKDVFGSPTRFKMPTLTFPKFGATSPNVTVEVPDVNKDIKVHGAEITGPKLTISGEPPAVDIKQASVGIEVPSIDVDMKSKGVELEAHGSKFKLPKFGISMPKIKGPEIDLSVSKTGVDVTLPEAKGEVQIPDVELKEPSIEFGIPEGAATDIDMKIKKPRGSFPKFGFSKPEVKGPEVDVSLPKVDISLPEGKVEVKEPEVEIKAPETQVEVKDVFGSPTRFKMPTLKFPKFGAISPNVTVEVPDVNKDINVRGAEITGPTLTISGEAPAVDIKEASVGIGGPSIDVDMKSKGVELDAHGSKFKLPTFGVSLPKIKGPEIDLSVSKTGVDVTLPEAKADVQLPDVELKEPSIKVEIPEGAATDIEVKMKKPRISFPNFGFSKPEVKGPEVDVSLPKVDISLPEEKLEVKDHAVEIKAPDSQIEVKNIELEGQGSKFKLPKFGISMPKIKGPEIDLSVSKTGVDVTSPEAKGEVQLPDVELKGPSIEVGIPEGAATDIDVKMKKPRISFPNFGFSKPEVKGPEVDVSLPKVDISLPEGKVEVKEPEVEIKAPETQVEVKDVFGSPTRFKMPTLKFPKFGATSPNVTVEVPDVNKDIKVHGAEITGPTLTISGEVPAVDIKEASVGIGGPSIDVDMKSKGVELDAHGSKFKLPTFGISMPKIKGPEIDLSVSKTGVDVTLPEAKGEVQLPDVELKGRSIEVGIPEGAATDIDMKIKKPWGSFPKFGFSKPEVKGPEVDVSLPKVDISLPEGKVEVKEPEVEIKAPETQVEVKDVFGSPTRFKMPTLKFPKFGATSPNVTVEVPDVNKDIKVHGAEITGPTLTISGEVPAVDIKQASVGIESPSIDVEMKSKGVELEAHGSKFKLPKFGISMPKIKGPEIDLSVSKTGVDVTLPEAKGEVELPDVELKGRSIEVGIPEGAATDIDVKMKKPRISFPNFGFSKPEVKGPEVDVSLPKVDISLPEGKVEVKEPEVEIKAPETQVEVKDVFGSPTRFKMPTLKFPKFGATSPNVTVEVPAVNKDIKVHGAEITGPTLTISGEVPAVDIKETSVGIGGPSIDVEMKSKGVEHEAHGSKFKLPKFGISMPKIKGPEIDLSVSKTGVDVTLPEAKGEVQIPDVELKGRSIEVGIPEGAATDIDMKIKKPRGSFLKFGFSKPEVKGPEVDVSLPKVDISLPEGKVEVKEPEVEIKAPETQVEVKDVFGSPTRFKMPTLKFPKFGATAPNVTVEVPDVNKDIKVHGAEITGPKLTISGEPPAVDIKQASVGIEGPSIDVEMKSKGVELEAHGSKFKLPKFGISMPKIKGPEIDLSVSKTGVDVTLPEAKGEVQIPDVELKEPSIEVGRPEGAATDIDMKIKKPRGSFPKFGFSKPEVKGPEVDVSLPKVDISLPEGKVEVKEPEVEIKAPESQAEQEDVAGSTTRFKMPTFKFPTFGATAPNVTVEVPDVKKDINVRGAEITGAKITMSGDSHAVDIKKASVDIEGPSIDVEMKSKGVELEGHGSKFKLPTFGVSLPKVKGPEINLNVSKTDIPVDVSLPQAKVEVQIADIDIIAPSGEVEMPEGPATDIDVKMKKPRMSNPFANLGFSKPEVKAPEVDVSLPKVDISLPEGKVEVKEPEVKIKAPESQVEVKDVVGSPTRFKMPTFKFPTFGTTSLKVDDSDKDKDIKGTGVEVTAGQVPGVSLQVNVPEPGDTAIKGSSSFNAEGLHVDLDTKSKGIEIDGQDSQFKLPKFSLRNLKGPGVDMDMSESGVGVSTTEGQAKVQLPDAESERTPAEGEVEIVEGIATAETGSKDDASIKGSPRKFKLPTFTMPKFGVTTQKPNLQSPDIKTDITISAMKETDIETNIKADVGQINTDHPELEAVDSEMSKQTTDSKDHGSPSKFKLPAFKMPRFSISKSKPEDEHENEERDSKDKTPTVILQKEIQVDTQRPDKSPKLTLTSFGEVLRGIDVEFDVPSLEEVEEKLTGSREELNAQLIAETQPVHKEDEVKEKSKSKFKFPRLGFNRAPEDSDTVVSTHLTVDENEKQPEPKEEEKNAEKESNTTPEKVAWFKFPKFGLSSPSESVKISEKEKEDEVSEKNSIGETVEDVSLTFSVQSSDAFADISSTVTSEQVGPSLASPTKVTVKYSDPVATMGLGGVKGNIITSTTRTELISLEPHLPEKITIPMSSGVSSSSVDTLKQESGDIHVITSNIQAIPATQHATLLTDFQVHSADALSRKTKTMKTSSADWSVEDTHRTLSGEGIVIEKHVVREMSSKDMETVVITQRVTHVFGVDPVEPISDETASSIQRLKDTMHSEKMKYFDGAKM